MSDINSVNLVVIGCGNIGLRHLEGLLKLNRKTNISIVEPIASTRKLAKLYLLKLEYDKEKHTINWFESIEKLDVLGDLTIVATTSVGRVDLIIKLLEKGNSRFLIEKVVCQSVDEYDLLLTNMKKFNAKSWVNVNRRYFLSYQKIKKLFPPNMPLHMTISAGNKGLGSNAIHYLDLFNWFIQDEKTKLNGTCLDNQIFPNKRSPDLLEFAGTIVGSNKMSKLKITFVTSNSLPIIIDIFNEMTHIQIDEINENVISIKGHNSEIKFNYEHVSDLTNEITEDILKDDCCLLPTTEQMYFAHKEIFKIFNIHIKKIYDTNQGLCPIT